MDTNSGEEYRHMNRFIKVQRDEANKQPSLLTIVREGVRARVDRLREWSINIPGAPAFSGTRRDAEILKLMICLQDIRDIPSKQLRTGSDIAITRITNRLRLISAGLFLVILADLGIHLLHVVDPAYTRLAAVATNLVLTIFVLLAMIFDAVIPLLCIIFPMEFEFRIRQLELAHDLRLADKLSEFDLDTLKAGEQWLGMKLDRLKFRMLMMFGGSDKLAMFALVGLGWSIRKLLLSEAGLLSEQWVTVVFAGLLGATLGGLLAHVVVKRLLYKKDILTLAIRKREDGESNTTC